MTDKTLEITVAIWIATQFAILVAAAQERQVIYETLPGTTVRDYSKPALIVETEPTTRWSPERVTIYQSIPGTDVRDYSKKAYIAEKEN